MVFNTFYHICIIFGVLALTATNMPVVWLEDIKNNKLHSLKDLSDKLKAIWDSPRSNKPPFILNTDGNRKKLGRIDSFVTVFVFLLEFVSVNNTVRWVVYQSSGTGNSN